MIFKNLLILVFILSFLYAIIRPSRNIFSKLFLIFGSILGFLSVIGENYVIKIANFLGIDRGTDLFVYIGLTVIFFFIFYTLDRLSKLKKEIGILSRKIALKKFSDDDK